MRNLYLYITLLLFVVFNSYSQGENNNWYFGNNAGLNFVTNPPTALLDSQMNQFEGVASISNSNGQLLFYTNGRSIWNRDHQIMLNGTGLTGSDSTQQVLIVPHPGNANLYYIFTMPFAYPSSSFAAFSIVDMSLGTLGLNGNPLGGVISTSKNIPILNENGQQFTYTTEAITYTVHHDNASYWILMPNGTKLYSYRLDGNGFNNIPITSNLTFPDAIQTYGQIKISPRLSSDLQLPYTNLVSITRWNGPTDIRVNSFNDMTGLLTSNYELQANYVDAYSTEFSADGLLLYAGRRPTGNIYVFDLFTSNQANLLRQIYLANLSCGTIQRAINNEIYISYENRSFLSKILNPNSFLTSSIELNSISLLGRNARYGLPQLVPILPQPTCQQNLTLSTVEANSSFTYQVSNSITTNNNYTVNSGQNIILNAGNSIEMKPNTHIASGSIFLAKIQDCNSNIQKISDNINKKDIKYVIDLEKEKNKLTIFPNPVTDYATISLENSKIKQVTISSIDGKTVYSNTVENIDSYQLNVSDYQKGIYILTVETIDGEKIIEKLVKK